MAAVEAPERELYGIAELCREFGITPRALRFYESKGLIEPQRVGATRIYTRRERARLAIILRSKAIGASLEEIGHFLALYGDHGEGRVRQLRWLKTRTDAAIAELEAKREHIDSLLAEIRGINAVVGAKLAAR
jgi:DNA-binding transcriptional MerR regulator